METEQDDGSEVRKRREAMHGTELLVQGLEFVGDLFMHSQQNVPRSGFVLRTVGSLYGFPSAFSSLWRCKERLNKTRLLISSRHRTNYIAALPSSAWANPGPIGYTKKVDNDQSPSLRNCWNGRFREVIEDLWVV